MSVIGQDRERPDVRAKVAGQFRYSNDWPSPACSSPPPSAARWRTLSSSGSTPPPPSGYPASSPC